MNNGALSSAILALMVEEFRERLIRLREERGLSPTELARLAEVDQGNLSKIEASERKDNNTSAKTVIRLARVLGVHPEYLWTGDGPQTLRSLPGWDDARAKLQDLGAAVELAGDALPPRPLVRVDEQLVIDCARVWHEAERRGLVKPTEAPASTRRAKRTKRDPSLPSVGEAAESLDAQARRRPSRGAPRPAR